MALNLTRAKAGTLQLGDQHHGFLLDGLLELDGLSYTGLPGLGDLDRLGPRPPGARGPSRRGRRAASPHAADVAQWLWWLRECSADYRAQPYEALAAAYGGAGYDDLARRILVAQRDDVRDRGSLSLVRTLGQHCAKWLIGYGYHCFYAFLWLAGLFTVTALIAVFWLGPDKYIVAAPAAAAAASHGGGQPGGHRQSARHRQSIRGQPAGCRDSGRGRQPIGDGQPGGQPGRTNHRVRLAVRAGAPPRGLRPAAGHAAATVTRQCSDPARVGYAIELAFPLINLNSSSAAQCDVPASGAAAGVVVFGWVVRAAAAALLALYTLGLTGVTRSPPGSG